MRLLTQPELNRRFRDLLLNILRLTADAKIGLAPISEDAVRWWEKITHVLEEMQLRHGPYPAGFSRETVTPDQEPFPDFASELAGKAAATLSKLKLQRGDVFIKFGKRHLMTALFEHGRLRIQPASYFSDKNHNPAVRDDELSLDLSFALSRDDIVALVKNPQDVPPNAGDQRANVSVRFSTDYWLFCVTNSVEPRLFVDFAADSCVIVRDRKAFSERLRAQLDPQLTEARRREGNAIYVDPLLPPKGFSPRVFIPLAKHFGYTYQDEYRFCWFPRKPTPKLTHLDVEIGSLKGITELITL